MHNGVIRERRLAFQRFLDMLLRSVALPELMTFLEVGKHYKVSGMASQLL